MKIKEIVRKNIELNLYGQWKLKFNEVFITYNFWK